MRGRTRAKALPRSTTWVTIRVSFLFFVGALELPFVPPLLSSARVHEPANGTKREYL